MIKVTFKAFEYFIKYFVSLFRWLNIHEFFHSVLSVYILLSLLNTNSLLHLVLLDLLSILSCQILLSVEITLSLCIIILILLLCVMLRLHISSHLIISLVISIEAWVFSDLDHILEISASPLFAVDNSHVVRSFRWDGHLTKSCLRFSERHFLMIDLLRGSLLN